MYGWSKLNKNESGQAALEAAIILIAFVVVASVFAFAILSAGSASTEKGEQAIYAGLQGVQSSMEIKGAVTAAGNTAGDAVDTITFTVALVAGGTPVNLGADGVDAAADSDVVIAYRDATVSASSLNFDVDYIIFKDDTSADALLEENELAEITVHLDEDRNAVALSPAIDLAENLAFSLEIKPPTGGVLQINRSTPAAIEDVMELR